MTLKTNNKNKKNISMYTTKLRSQNKNQTTTLNKKYTKQQITNMMNTPTCTSHKRLGEVMLASSVESTPKTPRSSVSESHSQININSPLKFIQIMDKRFEKLTEKLQTAMQTMFRECEDRLLKMIDLKINTAMSELSNLAEKVKNIETVVEENKNEASEKIIILTSETDQLKKEIVFLKSKVKQQENKNISCELRLNEIPYSSDEDLYKIFENICSTINTSVPAVKTIYRLQNHNNKHNLNSRDAVIIVKMWSPYDKNHFLKTFADFRRKNKGFFFCLRHIGINSDNKFFVNENLTSANFKLLCAANRLKKEHYIYSAYTIRGLVHIRKSQNDQAILIDDLDHLNNLFRARLGSSSAVGELRTDVPNN